MALLMLVVTGLSVAREREMGTFDQLPVTPMRPLALIGLASMGAAASLFRHRT